VNNNIQKSIMIGPSFPFGTSFPGTALG